MGSGLAQSKLFAPPGPFNASTNNVLAAPSAPGAANTNASPLGAAPVTPPGPASPTPTSGQSLPPQWYGPTNPSKPISGYIGGGPDPMTQTHLNGY